MPTSLRLDQTITGTISYKDNAGNPVALPADLVLVSSPQAHVAAIDATGRVTIHAAEVGNENIHITGSGVADYTETLTVTAAAPPVGTIVWDPPTPA